MTDIVCPSENRPAAAPDLASPAADPAPDGPPDFPRQPGETPRAFGAFLAFFQLGHARSLPAVAAGLGEKLNTVRRWSSRYRWSARLHAFQSGLLRRHAAAEAESCRKLAADWARRDGKFREEEWSAAQKLLTAAQCYLENLGEREVEKMSLAQVSRAILIATRISRDALRSNPLPEETALSPIQEELTAALRIAYGRPAAVTVTATSASPVGDVSLPSTVHPRP